jgi:hypothetical protein
MNLTVRERRNARHVTPDLIRGPWIPGCAGMTVVCGGHGQLAQISSGFLGRFERLFQVIDQVSWVFQAN